MCQKTPQLIKISMLCNGVLDCIDRSDESNCFEPKAAAFKDIFNDCEIDATNNFKSHSQINEHGFKCGKNICLDIDIFCSLKVCDMTRVL